MRRKLKIVGGPHGFDTVVTLDGVEQKMLISITLIAEAGETNRLILEYANIDVEIDVDVEEDDIVEELS